MDSGGVGWVQVESGGVRWWVRWLQVESGAVRGSLVGSGGYCSQQLTVLRERWIRSRLRERWIRSSWKCKPTADST